MHNGTVLEPFHPLSSASCPVSACCWCAGKREAIAFFTLLLRVCTICSVPTTVGLTPPFIVSAISDALKKKGHTVGVTLSLSILKSTNLVSTASSLVHPRL